MSGRGTYGVENKPRIPISRRKLAGAGVTVIILVGIMFVVNYGLPSTSFHLEIRYP